MTLKVSTSTQFDLFQKMDRRVRPTTRYQGSKLKLLPWIWHSLQGLSFASVLDAFGGSGCVSYMLKEKGKRVTFNDYLRSNYLSAVALVQNSETRIEEGEIDAIIRTITGNQYDAIIQRNFADTFFTTVENRWLDVVAQNISCIPSKYRQALAYHALFQSCIIKRPYNLFHRKNLYMRTADVQRSFGNKSTWDTPFHVHFRNFVREANEAVFDSGLPCEAVCRDVMDVTGKFDLVYIDPPYVNSSAIGVDYFDFYHFLEGLASYDTWESRIDFSRKHRPLRSQKSRWSDSRTIFGAFEELFGKFSNSILAVSYRSDGIPSEAQMLDLLRKFRHNVSVTHFGEYKYALSKNGNSKELMFIGY